VRLPHPALLAPIAGHTDLPFRRLCREQGGVGLACTDLINCRSILMGREKALALAATDEHDRPLGMQVYGSAADPLPEAAAWAADRGAAIVDINMGCPVDKVTKKDGGSKLMCDVPGAVRLAEAVRAALPDRIPLTCKMRLGWDEDAYRAGCAGELARRLTRVGVAAITVHGRTTEMKFGGRCRLEGIRRVVEAVGEETGRYTGEAGGGAPVIGNGDVTEPRHAVAMIRETGCAGVMIGRGAFAMPWIFRLAWAMQAPAPGAPSEPGEDARLDILLAYFDRMREYRDDRYALHRVRHKISRMGKHINGSHCRPLKEGIRNARAPGEVYAAVESWRREAAVTSCGGAC
jgi:nifR3 family TIM-barrel protein